MPVPPHDPSDDEMSAWAESDEREIHPERGVWGEDARECGRELFAKYDVAERVADWSTELNRRLK